MKESLKFGLTGKSYSSVKRALKEAKTSASINDLIYVGGSTFVVAEVV
jgi:dihydrofolate synthase/folylpolyglutamate synthase